MLIEIAEPKQPKLNLPINMYFYYRKETRQMYNIIKNYKRFFLKFIIPYKYGITIYFISVIVKSLF